MNTTAASPTSQGIKILIPKVEFVAAVLFILVV